MIFKNLTQIVPLSSLEYASERRGLSQACGGGAIASHRSAPVRQAVRTGRLRPLPACAWREGRVLGAAVPFPVTEVRFPACQCEQPPWRRVVLGEVFGWPLL